MAGPPVDPDWPEYFLIALEEAPNVSRAAKLAGVDRTTAYDLRRDSPEFAARWDAAIAKAIDLIEANGMKRAAWGIKKPVFYQGKVVGHTREPSDAMAQFFLRSHKPEVYREHVHQHHEIGDTVVIYLPGNGRADEAVEAPVEPDPELEAPGAD